MLQVGQIVKLSDNKDYVVINRMNLHNVSYIYFMTNSKPLEIVIATEKIVNGSVVLNEIKDNDELEYILSQFALEKSKNKID